MVVPEQRDEVVGVGPHDGDRPEVLSQGQDAVVLEQHDRLPGHAAGQPVVLGGVVDLVGDARVRHALGRVEHPELEAGEHEPADRVVDVLLPKRPRSRAAPSLR